MRKKKIYVVGYDEDIQCIYGKNRQDDSGHSIVEWCQPMSAYDAKRKLKDLGHYGLERAIYRLVKVDPKEI